MTDVLRINPKRRRADACHRTLNWNSWQDSNPQPRRSKRRTLPVELQELEKIWSIVPDSNQCLGIGNAVS
jgi:hypothetical protein